MMKNVFQVCITYKLNSSSVEAVLFLSNLKQCLAYQQSNSKYLQAQPFNSEL